MSSVNNNLYAFADFSLDPQNRVVRRSGATVPLTPKAFDLLLVLVQNAGRIVSKDELMKTVWPDSFVEESNLTQTVFMVRKALDETPDRRYIQTVQGQGYRFLVPVKEATLEGPEGEPPGTERPLAASETVEVREVPVEPSPPEVKSWRPLVIACAAVALVLILVFAIWPWHPRVSPAEPGKIMLAVLPFENFTGDSSEDYFSDGLTEEMIGQLGNLDPAHLGVIARTSVMHYKHSQESIPAIGRDLGVQYVIEGSVRRDEKRARITVQLIQVKDQSHLWARQYDRDLGHLLELQEEVAREVANEIEFSLSGRRPIEAAQAAAPVRGANSYETYDLYLKGRYFWNKRTADGFRQAANYFQQAIDKDPNFARAYAGLADTFALMSTWFIGPQNELMPKARAMALRALQLDESLADAHASLAMIKENYDYDWPGAEKEFRRALELDPQYATAHQWYAEFLSWQGRFAEAFAESEQARQLDPISLIGATDRASILYESRQYESALKQWRSVLDLDPTYDHAEHKMIPAYLQLGRYDDAIKVIDRWEAVGEGPWMWGWKAAVYARAGHPDEARRALAKLEQSSGSPASREAPLLIAYLGTGQKERALELLQQMYAEHSNAVVQIKVDPMFDPLRSDPRFKDLLLRLGLER
ncbi:MAG: winged helix-turn-helix domain-containing protein [Terriglobales bacterium]|jgi:TolB-like protein/DNA-binding winged helix-turn-helix (wHTH) protein/Tfp pilus assembly protein PilF